MDGQENVVVKEVVEEEEEEEEERGRRKYDKSQNKLRTNGQGENGRECLLMHEQRVIEKSINTLIGYMIFTLPFHVARSNSNE